MNTTIIFDAGSCHEGDYDKALLLCGAAITSRAEAIKFQILPDELCKNGNISFNRDWLPNIHKLCENVIDCYYSVWTIDDAELASKYTNTVKIAHSKMLNYELINYCLDHFRTTYITLDTMQKNVVLNKRKFCYKLWTYTLNGETVYPVECNINFTNVFSYMDGFSDHTHGYNQTLNAIDELYNSGELDAKIEKHLCINNNQNVPDARFAVPIDKAAEFVKKCRDHGFSKEENEE